MDSTGLSAADPFSWLDKTIQVITHPTETFSLNPFDYIVGDVEVGTATYEAYGKLEEGFRELRMASAYAALAVGGVLTGGPAAVGFITGATGGGFVSNTAESLIDFVDAVGTASGSTTMSDMTLGANLGLASYEVYDLLRNLAKIPAQYNSLHQIAADWPTFTRGYRILDTLGDTLPKTLGLFDAVDAMATRFLPQSPSQDIGVQSSKVGQASTFLGSPINWTTAGSTPALWP